MEERLPVSPPPQQSPTTGTTHSRPSTMLSATAPDPTTPLHPPPSPLTSVQSPGQLQVNRTAVSANTKLSDEKPDSLDEKLDSSLLSTAWDKYKEFEAFRYRYLYKSRIRFLRKRIELAAVFRIHIHWIRIRIQPKISIQIRIQAISYHYLKFGKNL